MNEGYIEKKLGKLGVFLAFLLLPMSALAAPIPSSASGHYIGGGALFGKLCTVYFRQIGSITEGTNRVLDVHCFFFPEVTRHSGAISATYECVDERMSAPLPEWGGPCAEGPGGVQICVFPWTPTFTALSFSTTTTHNCALGELQAEIGEDVGYMCRTEILVPPQSYPGCGSPTALSNTSAPRKR